MIPDLIATREAFLSNIFITLIIFCRRRWNRACCYLLLILRSYRRRFAHYDELISPFRSLHEAMILINQHKTEVVELRHWAKCRRRKNWKTLQQSSSHAEWKLLKQSIHDIEDVLIFNNIIHRWEIRLCNSKKKKKSLKSARYLCSGEVEKIKIQ